MSGRVKVSLRSLFCVAALLAAASISGCGSPEERAEAHYERGMKLLAENDTVKASLEFKSALQQKKEHLGASRALAKIEEKNGNYAAVIYHLRNVAQNDPKDVDARIRLGRLLILSNTLDEALKWIDEAAKLDDHNAAVLAVRGAIQLKLNNTEAALSAANDSLKIDPTNTEALIVLAAERMTRQDVNGALEILGRSPEDKGDLGIELFKLRLYEQQADHAKIEESLRKLAKRYPNEVAVRRQLVTYYVSQKRLDDAEVELRATAADNPTNIEATLDIARFLNTFKGPEVAQRELEARIAAGGNKLKYQMLLADLYVAQGNVDQATGVLEGVAKDSNAPADALAAKARLAELHLASKKLDAATTLVSSILTEDARNVAGLRLRASIALEREQYDAAIADLRQALNDQPQSQDLKVLLAFAYERKGEIELAEKQFADTAKAANFEPSVALSYVAFLRRRGSLDQAENVLTEILARSPKNPVALSNLAEVRLARQNWLGAQEVADTLRASGNNQSTADQILAAALSGQKKYDESVGILQTTYAAAPGDTRSMYALINTLLRAEKPDRAVAFLQTALEKDPKNADALVLLGSIQLSQNERDKAIANFKSAIEQQPKSIVGYRALGNAYLQQRNTDEAIATFKAGLEQSPDSGVLRLALASALELKGDFEAAISEYETLLSQQSGSMIVANNLASLLSDHRTDEASLQRAYTLAAGLRSSPVPQFKDTLGWVYYRRGDHKGAVSLLEKAAEELPAIPLVRYHLGMAYVASGEPAKASEQLKKGLELVQEDADLKKKIEGALQQLSKS